ncbi:MAG: alpha/beta hydrolase-fold protein [Candidimonas sp.]
MTGRRVDALAAPPTWPNYAETRCASRDGKRTYLVRASLPSGPAPAAGFPVLCMLDGDWTRPALVAALSSAPSAIIVGIGYDSDEEGRKAARAYDYTPQVVAGRSEFDPRVPAWRSGGAAPFLDMLEARLLPDALAHCPADRSRMTLFGHSYGGLCVLYSLLERAPVFKRYAAASPSLWWRDGHFLRTTLEASTRPDAPETAASRGRELLVMAGERERWHPRSVGPDGSPQSRLGGVPTLPSMRQLVHAVEACGMAKAELSVFPEMGHGDMLLASALRALHFCTRNDA